jgi:hypothetical protein
VTAPPWFVSGPDSSSPAWAVNQIEELLDDDLDGAQLRAEVPEIVGSTRPRPPLRRSIDQSSRHSSPLCYRTAYPPAF